MTQISEALSYVIKSVSQLKAAHCSGTCAYNVSMVEAVRRFKVNQEELENAYTKHKRGSNNA